MQSANPVPPVHQDTFVLQAIHALAQAHPNKGSVVRAQKGVISLKSLATPMCAPNVPHATWARAAVIAAVRVLVPVWPGKNQ